MESYNTLIIEDLWEVAKEMESQTNPWFDIMGKKRLKESGTGILRLATKDLTLPKGSERFVKKSHESWES